MSNAQKGSLSAALSAAAGAAADKAFSTVGPFGRREDQDIEAAAEGLRYAAAGAAAADKAFSTVRAGGSRESNMHKALAEGLGYMDVVMADANMVADGEKVGAEEEGEEEGGTALDSSSSSDGMRGWEAASSNDRTAVRNSRCPYGSDNRAGQDSVTVGGAAAAAAAAAATGDDGILGAAVDVLHAAVPATADWHLNSLPLLALPHQLACRNRG
jgi:hypothetical protein